MFKFSSLSKKFSRIAQVRVTPAPIRSGSEIYFSIENETRNTDHPFVEGMVSGASHELKDIKKNKIAMIYPWSTETVKLDRLCYVETPKNDVTKLRTLASTAMRSLMAYNPSSINVMFSQFITMDQRKEIINSLILTNYSFRQLGTASNLDDQRPSPSQQINIVSDSLNGSLPDSLNLAINFANATLHTRNLANTRANIANCDFLEQEALKLQANRKDVDIEIIKGEDLKASGLNLLYAVGQGAQSEPRLIILNYRGNPESDVISHAIVGKGLTFDTGGLNLKGTNFIETMYYDKHGACNTLAIFKSVTGMNLPVNLVCAIAVAENSIDSRSYKPSDIITSHKVLNIYKY